MQSQRVFKSVSTRKELREATELPLGIGTAGSGEPWLNEEDMLSRRFRLPEPITSDSFIDFVEKWRMKY